MNEAILFCALQVCVLILTLLGAGIFPSTVCAAAILTFGAYAFTRLFPRRHAGGFAPTDSLRGGMPGCSPALEMGMAAILLILLISALPLPPFLDPLIGHLRASQNRTAAAWLQEGARLGFFHDSEPWFCLSRNRAGTLRMFLMLSAVFGAALCAACLPARWKQGHLTFLAWAGAVVAAGGYVSQWWIPEGDTLWWTIPISHALPGPVGCFINRNHFGGFVAMLCPVAVALTDRAFCRRQWLQGFLMLLLASIMAFAVILSHSRGSMLAFAIGTGATVGWLLFRRSLLAGLLSLLSLAGLAVTVYFSTPSLQTRLDELQDPLNSGSGKTRLLEWRETLRTAAYYPFIGAGANALRMAYPLHRTTSGKWLVNAENEYVQLAAEGGLLGLGLAGTLAVAAWRRRTRQEEAGEPALRVAVWGALLTAASHNMVDFPARLPLYAVTLGSLAGLLLNPPPLVEGLTAFRLRLLPAAIAVTGAAMLTLVPLSSLQRLDSYSLLGAAEKQEIQRAIAWAPTSWNAWYMAGRTACEEGISKNRLDFCIFGESLMTQAARCDPNNYRLWYDVGLTRRALGEYSRADAAFARAQELRPWMKPPPRERKKR